SEECAAVQAKFPRLTLETDAAFHVILPASTGACPYSALIGQRWNVVIPVYRLWKPHGGSNHRYTTNDAVRDEMLRRGWVSEGYGPMGVAMCALGSPWDY
ncbi:MAG TPA: hypothetical protein VNE58_15005, partial [Casimicrobiaceae bacterium]|nr:hypothetical protein [Casimicrobiaceae bacterium]